MVDGGPALWLVRPLRQHGSFKGSSWDASAPAIGVHSGMARGDQYRMQEPDQEAELPGTVNNSSAAEAEQSRHLNVPGTPQRLGGASSDGPAATPSSPKVKIARFQSQTNVLQINEQFMETYKIQVTGHDKREDELTRDESGDKFGMSTARRDHKTINPENGFRLTWNIIQSVILVYVASVVPFRIGFDVVLEPYTYGWWFEAGVDAFFIVDSESTAALLLH